MKAPPRIITIVCRDNGNGDFDIHIGEYVVTRLGWDEMLGSIAVITHPLLSKQTAPLPPYARLQHIDEVLDRHIYWREKAKDAAALAGDDPEFREVGE